MITNQQTSREYFRFLQIIFYALLSGQLLLGIVFVINQYRNIIEPVNNMTDDIFIYAVPILAVACLTAAFFFFSLRINAIKKEPNLIKKMTDYRSLQIIRYSLLEAPSLFSIVVFYITANRLYLGLAGLIIIIFFYFKPSRDRAITELELNASETYKINDPNAVIAEISSKE